MPNPTVICNGKTVELTVSVFPEPVKCPWCDQPTRRRETQSGDGAITECTNTQCPKRSVRKLRNWFRKVEILGVGESILEALNEQLNINTAADIYKLGATISVGEIAEITIGDNIRMGESRAESLVAEISKKRSLPLNIFLGSIGIDHLDRRRVEIMMEKVPGELDTLDDWLSGKLNDPEFAKRAGVPGMGAGIQASLEAFTPIIKELLANGVSVAAPAQQEKPAEDGGLVCITGTLPSGKIKADYKQPLAAVGYVLVDDVSKDISFLVVANPSIPSKKQEKAAKYNSKGACIKIIDEAQLQALLKGQL